MKECPTCCRCFPDNLNHCPTDGEALRFTIAGDTVLDGRYQLERRLGQGGMGVVYKGRHVFLKTQHAIKIILPDLVGNDPSLLTRFRQEAMAAAAIRHPNIVSVTDFGVVNNTTPFLVMEFLEGRSLHDLLSAESRLEPARAVEIMLAVASGVAAAHRQGIVHRDLKPLNLMLCDGGTTAGDRLKILDFGLAKIKSGDLLGSFIAAKTQGLMGSPFYMAPEQWGDDEPEARSDIYSLGVILYQMLAGEVPFKGNSIPSIMNKHLTAQPPPLVEKGVEVPPEVERVILRALEKEPGKRQESVEEFAAELRAALAALGGATAIGSDTASDIGLRTVAIKEPHTVPPDACKTYDDPSDVGQGGRTVADISTPPAPQRGFETVASGEMFRPDSAPETEAPPPRSTARDLTPAPPVSNVASPDAQKTYASPSKRTQPLTAQQQTDYRIAQPQTSSASLPSVVPAQAEVAQTIPGMGGPDARPFWSRLPLAVWAAAGVLALLCVVAGLYALFKDPEESAGANANVTTGGGTGTNSGPQPGATPFKPDLIQLAGGTFMMGRNDVPPRSAQVSVNYQAWVYNQWPAHSVNIKPFAIDRTEVPNAEYAEFVAKTGYPAPPDWDGKRPPAGQELWPVRNVTLEDAERFAKWRSQRDGVVYRLPTEEEWEYAARAGDAARLFPWGREWIAGRANLESDALRPVGSFPEGATPQGALDMIGNVWEWTSTRAGMYRGNNLLVLAPGDESKIVVRGGGYQSMASGDEPITATARRWVVRDKRDPVVGFRLVQPKG